MVGGKRKLTATRIAFKQEAASFRGSFRQNEGIPLKEASVRAIAGVLLAVSIALAARRARTLSASGVIAAAIIGTLTIAAGWSWGALLLGFFITSSALSKLGERKKSELAGAVAQKSGARDARQVLANGGVYALSALGYLLVPSAVWYATAAGALAASTGDTWSTEVGTLVGGEPVSIASGKKVPSGTSGGITVIGTVAGALGAMLIAGGAALASWPVGFAAVALGGLAGSVADSLLGATLQSRRWCDLCAKATERSVHSCGTPTRHAGGLAGFDNDAVNAVCSGVGALIALLLA